MTSTFLSLQIGLSALQANSMGVETTGHNIANANTDGYAREVVDAETETPLAVWTDHHDYLGEGVNARGQDRVVNESLNTQYRNNNAQQSYWDTYSTEVGNVGKIFNEPTGTTLRQSMDAFYNAWNTLSQTPSDNGARAAVYEASQQLTDAFHNTASALQTSQTRFSDQLDSAVSEFNQLATTLAETEQQIVKSTAMGTPPNDLLDQRDSLLDKMSQYAAIQVTHETDGSVTVQLVGQGNISINLVQGGQVQNQLSDASTIPNPQTAPPTVLVSSLVDKSGKLSALNDMITYTQGVSRQVDQLAQDMAGAVNAQYNQGYDENGSQPSGAMQDLFWGNGSSSTPVTGANIGVNPNLTTLNLNSLPAGSTAPVTNPGPPPTTQPYATDGGNADAVAQQMSTYDQEYAGIVTRLGIDGQAANAQNQTFTALETQVSQMKQSVSGVNINEEMAHMVQYQQSYGAASKFISVFNDMLNTLIQSV